MTKPNFVQMSKEELIAYVKVNRTDDEAIRELFSVRRNPNSTIYPYIGDLPEEEQVQEMKKIEDEIRQKIDKQMTSKTINSINYQLWQAVPGEKDVFIHSWSGTKEEALKMFDAQMPGWRTQERFYMTENGQKVTP